MAEIVMFYEIEIFKIFLFVFLSRQPSESAYTFGDAYP
jgi:hypothetical protein